MRWLAAALAMAACSGSAFPGDALCADGGCPSGQACTRVVDVLATDGRCLPSTGADVCRAVCPQCPATIVPCGCVCPP